MKDPVIYDLNRYMDSEAAQETWYEQNENDLADEFYEKMGVEAFDRKAWEAFLDLKWQHACEDANSREHDD